jgi:hypothetical protein
MSNEQKFINMMGENINCWMSSYYEALPFIAELIIDGKVKLDSKTNLEELSEELARKYFAFSADTFSSLLGCFISLSSHISFEVLDGLGIAPEDLWEIGLNSKSLEDMFLNNPKKSAELLLKAQREFQPVYN